MGVMSQHGRRAQKNTSKQQQRPSDSHWRGSFLRPLNLTAANTGVPVMRVAENICANSQLLERPGQVRTEPAGDADECGLEKPAPSRRLGLLIVLSTAAVTY